MDDLAYPYTPPTPEQIAQGRRSQYVYQVSAFKDDDIDTMVRRLEALEHFVVNGINEVTD